ncbi:helix-turn-helix domain-containing protein [uncultured Apibacter sp.]|uniref:winged helix-turn-helix transcriptional regulator n=1 Tax=uncultured Apibacter sp. TaxID=1778616 RepID=UPI0025F8B76D|nr:helix-turn-helix domain-containing protein [uncultured Apibacter sp.]
MEIRNLDLKYPSCPIRNILSRFSDKWSLLILVVLQSGLPMRYGELKKNIPDISQKMLSKTLKNLEKHNLIIRKAYLEIPPKVEYYLSETGKGVLPIIQSMIDWVESHKDEIFK